MKIVCATDFSDQGRAACDLAVELARLLGDGVEIVHVVDPTRQMAAKVPALVANWQTLMTETAEHELQAEVRRLQAHPVRVDHKVLVGRVSDRLSEVASEQGVRLLVVGTHGRKAAARLFVGSEAETTVRHAPCPVVVTRAASRPAGILAAGRRLHLMVLADGSPSADAALGWVKRLRQEVPCDLTFVEPYWRSVEENRFGVGEEDPARAGELDLHHLLEREFWRWVGVLPGTGEARLRLHASSGNPINALVAEAESIKPDLVVVGTSPYRFSHQGHALPVSTALRASRVPVVCVPEALRPARDKRIPLVRTVLVATDLSDFANQAVPAAYALLRGTGGTVVICHVVVWGSPLYPPVAVGETGASLEPTQRQALESQLAELAPPQAAALGIRTQVAVIEAAMASEGIRREAARIEADVVVVASHGHSGLRRALMGSVAAELAQNDTRPLLVLHPPQR